MCNTLKRRKPVKIVEPPKYEYPDYNIDSNDSNGSNTSSSKNKNKTDDINKNNDSSAPTTQTNSTVAIQNTKPLNISDLLSVVSNVKIDSQDLQYVPSSNTIQVSGNKIDAQAHTSDDSAKPLISHGKPNFTINRKHTESKPVAINSVSTAAITIRKFEPIKKCDELVTLKTLNKFNTLPKKESITDLKVKPISTATYTSNTSAKPNTSFLWKNNKAKSPTTATTKESSADTHVQSTYHDIDKAKKTLPKKISLPTVDVSQSKQYESSYVTSPSPVTQTYENYIDVKINGKNNKLQPISPGTRNVASKKALFEKPSNESSIVQDTTKKPLKSALSKPTNQMTSISSSNANRLPNGFNNNNNNNNHVTTKTTITIKSPNEPVKNVSKSSYILQTQPSINGANKNHFTTANHSTKEISTSDNGDGINGTTTNYEQKTIVSFSKDLLDAPNKYPEQIRVTKQVITESSTSIVQKSFGNIRFSIDPNSTSVVAKPK